MWKASMPAMLDELSKLGTVSDEEAQKALKRYESLEEGTPSAGQVARYAGLGAVAGPAVNAVGNAIRGGRGKGQSLVGHLVGAKGKSPGAIARGLAGSAVTGAIGSGAIPLVRDHLDRRAEMGTLRQYMAEREPERHMKSAGNIGEPFVPVEESVGGVSKLGTKKKEKDSAATEATPAQPWNGHGFVLSAFGDEEKNAFAESAYSAHLGSPAVKQHSQIAPFRVPSLRKEKTSMAHPGSTLNASSKVGKPTASMLKGGVGPSTNSQIPHVSSQTTSNGVSGRKGTIGMRMPKMTPTIPMAGMQSV
jgi:hypothetical protein